MLAADSQSKSKGSHRRTRGIFLTFQVKVKPKFLGGASVSVFGVAVTGGEQIFSFRVAAKDLNSTFTYTGRVVTCQSIGSISRISCRRSRERSGQTLRALITRNGGEVTDDPDI